MTDTSISAVVNPQDFGTGVVDGDEDYISAGYDTIPTPNTRCIINGLGLSADYTAPSVDIAPGVAQVPDTGVAVQSGAQTTYDTTIPGDSFQHVIVPDSVTITLADGVVTELWIAVNPSNQDDVYIRHGSGLNAPSDPSVKIGEVDTSNDTTRERWYAAASDGTLTFPDETAADSASSGLAEGTVVYDRAGNTHYYVS